MARLSSTIVLAGEMSFLCDPASKLDGLSPNSSTAILALLFLYVYC
jgi:hypothetical protein